MLRQCTLTWIFIAIGAIAPRPVWAEDSFMGVYEGTYHADQSQTTKASAKVIAELKLKQNRDGGWSLYGLGPWRWSKANPPFRPPGKVDLSLLEQSDGYATGLITYALLQARVPATDAAVVRATGWLTSNQQETQADQNRWKCWRAFSLNHVHEPGSSRGGAWERMMMSDLATAFGALALLSVEQGLGH